MHPDLSPNLHTPKCNELIKLLTDCHKDNPIAKYFGACNSIDADMLRCLKAEYEEKRRINYEKSEKLKLKIRQSSL